MNESTNGGNMDIKHCVSLELAKELKEAGWKKETEFYHDWKNDRIISKIKDIDIGWYKDCYSAPLATEILEELPKFIDEDEEYNLHIEKVVNNDFIIRYEDGNAMTYSGRNGEEDYYSCGKSLSDALAKMWLYLKKENLLTQKENSND